MLHLGPGSFVYFSALFSEVLKLTERWWLSGVENVSGEFWRAG